MKLDELISTVGSLPFFDLALLAQMKGEERNRLRVQLHRWMKKGQVIPLRRGVYTLAKPYRRVDPNPMVLANALYKPSYLTAAWALAFYDLIPETVMLFTSATPRPTRRFANAFGNFWYSTLKQDLFWGFETRRVGEHDIWIADPEKALLDYWYHSPGEWTVDRIAEMRFQNFEAVDENRLAAYATKWKSPRLGRAVRRWRKAAEADAEGTVEL